MTRTVRLESARDWLHAMTGRSPVEIAQAYRARYGVDWPCAFLELQRLGVDLDPAWMAQLIKTLEANLLAKQLRRVRRRSGTNQFGPDSDATFAYIAGHTEGGAPFGTTWEELKRAELQGRMFDHPIESSEINEAFMDDDAFDPETKAHSSYDDAMGDASSESEDIPF